MTESQLQRMNALWHKSKSEGLDCDELAEQKSLRGMFMEGVRTNLRAQLDNIDIQNPDGTVDNLGKKYGGKKDN